MGSGGVTPRKLLEAIMHFGVFYRLFTSTYECYRGTFVRILPAFSQLALYFEKGFMDTILLKSVHGMSTANIFGMLHTFRYIC